MTNEEYHEKMFRTNHSNTCSWGWDQYWWECEAHSFSDLQAKVKRAIDFLQPA